MPKLNKEFIVKLQGKDFVTYEGLLDLAHQKGLISIKTELIQLPTKENNNQCVMKAIAFTEKGQFDGYGDADSSNVNSNIAKHLIRMAETRAKARALRDLTNVGMTAVEEMGGEDKKGFKEPNNNNKGTSNNISDAQIKRLYAIANSKGINRSAVNLRVKTQLNKEVKNLNRKEYDIVCNSYENMKMEV